MSILKCLSLNVSLQMSVSKYRLSMCSLNLLDVCVGWLRLVGALKSQVSFAKEPYKRDDILQKRLIILRSLPLLWGGYD